MKLPRYRIDVFSVTTLSFVLSGLSHSQTAVAGPDVFLEPPDFEVSTFALHGGAKIQDSVFADKIFDTVTDASGNSNVRNATFLFQQCHGGGFIDDLKDRLGTTIDWLGGAASQWNEASAGLPSRRELNLQGKFPPPAPIFPDTGPDFWTASLFAAIDSNASLTLHDALGATIIADPIGTFGDGVGAFGINKVAQENSQRFDRNGGSFGLKDTNANGFEAIIIAGNVNRDRFRTDVEMVFDSIQNKWGDPATTPNVNVKVLFGNGTTDAAGNPLPAEWNAMAATQANIDAALAASKSRLDTDKQFFVYVSDHGGSNVRPVNLPGMFTPRVKKFFNIPLSDSTLLGYEADTGNPDPMVQLSFTALSTPQPGDSLDVTFNDTSLGSFPIVFGPQGFDVSVPESMLTGSNTLEIENKSDVELVFYDDSMFVGSSLTTLDALATGPPLVFSDPLTTPVELSAGSFGTDFVSQPDTPQPGITREIFIGNGSANPGSLVHLASANNGTPPGQLEIQFTGGSTGEGVSGAIGYDLGNQGRNLLYGDQGPIFELILAEPIVGDASLFVAIRDIFSTFDGIVLTPDASGLVYTGEIPTSTIVDLGVTRFVDLNFSLTAQSDVTVVIDSFNVIPEPAAVVLLAVGSLVITSRVKPMHRHPG